MLFNRVHLLRMIRARAVHHLFFNCPLRGAGVQDATIVHSLHVRLDSLHVLLFPKACEISDWCLSA